MKATAADGSLVAPATTCTAVAECGPSAREVARRHVHAPADATTGPQVAEPTVTSTDAPGSAVPERVGVRVVSTAPAAGAVTTGGAGMTSTVVVAWAMIWVTPPHWSCQSASTW